MIAKSPGVDFPPGLYISCASPAFKRIKSKKRGAFTLRQYDEYGSSADSTLHLLFINKRHPPQIPQRWNVKRPLRLYPAATLGIDFFKLTSFFLFVYSLAALEKGKHVKFLWHLISVTLNRRELSHPPCVVCRPWSRRGRAFPSHTLKNTKTISTGQL